MEKDVTGDFTSPGGFVFGVQGWNWGDQRPTGITFFLNGTVKVSDQHGRPMKGFVRDGKPVYMERLTHEQALKYLTEEFHGLDWRTLACAGWPQLPYAQLKELKVLPPTPIDDLQKIPDPNLRRDALRIRREVDEARAKELQPAADE